jgi:hypothetical protein
MVNVYRPVTEADRIINTEILVLATRGDILKIWELYFILMTSVQAVKSKMEDKVNNINSIASSFRIF